MNSNYTGEWFAYINFVLKIHIPPFHPTPLNPYLEKVSLLILITLYSILITLWNTFIFIRTLTHTKDVLLHVSGTR